MSDAPQAAPGDDQPFDLEQEPLDRPQAFGIDWGGDGSDLSRPVRAHVLEALRPNHEPYPPPVDALLRIGDVRAADAAARLAALGFTQAHLPDLVRMMRDRGLYTADSDTDEVWAPFHAFRALSNLDVSGVIPALLPMLDLDDDGLSEELPDLLGRVGAPALEPLRAYLAGRTRWAFAHSRACSALEKMARQYPELREQVVEILCDVLRDAEHYHEIAVTGAMGSLIELRAVEALPLIRRTFEIGKIDEMMYGPWGSVLDELGVEPEDGDPLLAESEQRFEERQERFLPREQRERLLEALDRLQARERQGAPAETIAGSPLPPPPEQSLGAFARLQETARQRAPLEAGPSMPPPAARARPGSMQAKARKQKNKRKIEAASRKANRKKRK